MENDLFNVDLNAQFKIKKENESSNHVSLL